MLDVGRTNRLVTPVIWRALVCRDRHCAFPGCTRPPVMGHATTSSTGPTTEKPASEPGAALRHHHRTIHHTPWQVRLNPTDGKPEFLPPSDPEHHHPPGSEAGVGGSEVASTGVPGGAGRPEARG